MVLGVVVANCSGDHFGRMRTWRHSSEALIALSLQLRLGTGPAVATQTARLLGTNRGFDTRLPGGGSYGGQCRCAFLFYRQENISARTPPSVGANGSLQTLQ